MNNFWKKRIKNTSLVADKMGVNTQKIEDLKNGDLEISGKTLERVLEITNESKIEKELRKGEIFKWYIETDIRNLRNKFGYSRQKDVANILGMDNSTYCLLENKHSKITHTTDAVEKIYYFYTNELNKNTKINKRVGRGRVIDSELKDAIEYFKKNDLQDVLKELNMNKNEFLMNCIGYKAVGGEQHNAINEIINKKFKNIKNKKLVVNVYKWVKDYENNKTNGSKCVQNEDLEVKPIEELIIEEEPIKVELPIVEPVIEVEDDFIEEEIKNTEKEKLFDYEKMFEYEDELARKNDEIRKLKRQIMLYEKLIENLK